MVYLFSCGLLYCNLFSRVTISSSLYPRVIASMFRGVWIFFYRVLVCLLISHFFIEIFSLGLGGFLITASSFSRSCDFTTFP